MDARGVAEWQRLTRGLRRQIAGPVQQFGSLEEVEVNEGSVVAKRATQPIAESAGSGRA